MQQEDLVEWSRSQYMQMLQGVIHLYSIRFVSILVYDSPTSAVNIMIHRLIGTKRPLPTHVSVSTILAVYLDFDAYRSARRQGHYDSPRTDGIGSPLPTKEEIELEASGVESREGLLRR
jgi:hypothetical protein